MNERVNQNEPPRSSSIGSWCKEHPGFSVTIMAFVFSLLAVAHDQRSVTRDKPQWDKVHERLSDLKIESETRHKDLRSENRHMATYTLERGRYTDTMLVLIAKSAGIKGLTARPDELKRSELRVRDISERDD